MTAGEKGPKHPILSPKNLLETRDKRRAAAGGARPRPLSFHACFAWEPTHTPGFLPAAGHGWGGVAVVPRLLLRAVKGTRRRQAATRGAIFGKEFGNPSSKSMRKVPARWERLPRGLPLPLSVSPPPPPQGPPLWQRPAPHPRVFSWKEKRRKKNSAVNLCLLKPEKSHCTLIYPHPR